MNSIVIPPPAYNLHFDRVDLKLDEFQRFISARGYRVKHEMALRCPCKSEGGDNQSSCRNCGSTGWLWINPTETRMLIVGQGNKTDLQDYSENLTGQASISCDAKDQLAYMDRITLLDALSRYSEVAFLNTQGEGLLLYEPTEMEVCLVYDAPNQPLIRLTNNDIILTGNKIRLTSGALSMLQSNQVDLSTLTISVRYKHRPAYHIIDIPRDVLTLFEVNENRQDVVKQYPIKAIGKRAHYLIDLLKTKYSSGSPTGFLIDNSFTIEPVCQ